MSADFLTPPVPANEMERLHALSDLDLDYLDLQDNFKDMTKLAAKIAGTNMSVINLIDLYTQWSVSHFGLGVDQTPREDTVCQYTIMTDHAFEVSDLTSDERFKDKAYVTDAPNLKYYYGLPLQMDGGNNIGALCVLDSSAAKDITPEKSEMLKIIAGEIVNRFKALKAIQDLKSRLHQSNEAQKRVAHDIRGPIGGIIGLARIISEQGDENTLDEVLEFITLIQKSGDSLLELANEILSADAPKKSAVGADEFNQLMLKDKLEKLYMPQAVNKKINFTVSTNMQTEVIPFSKNKLLQIVGNLISNSMKFTPVNGSITVKLGLRMREFNNELHMIVEDTGVGMTDDKVQEILNGQGTTTDGTSGEKGYGFGLALVKHLVDSLKGTMYITSKPGEGTSFEIILPQNKR